MGQTVCVLYLIATFLLATPAYAISWDDRDAATRQIAACSGAYTRLSNQAQLMNNPGAATNYLSRAATTVATNMFLNRDGERVSSARIRLMKEAQAETRRAQAKDPRLVLGLPLACDEHLPEMIRYMGHEPPLFGKNFLEFKAGLVEQMKSQMGL